MAVPTVPLVNFTLNVPLADELSWKTNSDFEYSSYRGYHKAANTTLHWIFPSFQDYTGFSLDPIDLTYFSTEEETGNVDVDAMIWDNRGPLAFGAVGVVLALLLTFFGIGWCVFQCCCNSKKKGWQSNGEGENGGGSKSMCIKNSTSRIVCNIIMIGWRVLYV
jgi:hypothetical protein